MADVKTTIAMLFYPLFWENRGKCLFPFRTWLPITAVYCQLTDFATGNGLKAVTAYLLQ
jgi:hypothetical protein